MSKVIKKMQSCYKTTNLYKRINWDLFRKQGKSTLNTRMIFKNHNDIIQTIEHINYLISNLELNLT